MKRWPHLLYRLNRLRWRLTRPITVGVRLLLCAGDRVLLVKHTYQASWYLPGGGVQRGETLEQAARREAAEELGARLGPLTLHGVYSNFYEHKSDHVAVFCCHDVTLGRARDREIADRQWFAASQPPVDASPGTLRRLRELANPDLAPYVGRW